ncbi:hypothetical protein UR09_03730 [Candidatus Nitromaritima sp. SCGC AAA799-A02]|nr:hypothetical protein UR09_03730 [Candidatus Nitromaritima sp. SCGC AAA799-A02]
MFTAPNPGSGPQILPRSPLRARPLTLREALHLRDGLKLPCGFPGFTVQETPSGWNPGVYIVLGLS